MFDPAVMGTLLIGLDAVRAETDTDGRRRRSATPRRARVGIRVALARALRRAASLLEQPSAGEAGNRVPRETRGAES
jgi:hypothetical protein